MKTSRSTAPAESDAWGFRIGSRNSFLMASLEAGGKSSDIENKFAVAYPGSAGKSTFRVFFSDVVRPFGSASVSRDIRLHIDAAGSLQMDRERATAIKAAISKGLLSELTAVERNRYPKNDRIAIRRILDSYGLFLSDWDKHKSGSGLARLI